MIQRIQTLWLLLAAASVFLLFKFPLYGGLVTGGSAIMLMAADNMVLFILAMVLAALPLVAIFLFRNRGTQKKLIWLSLLLCVLSLVLIYMNVEDFRTANTALTSQSYKLATVFPVLYIILLIMAYSGVRKDEKLIKSVDRLR